jgi:hypothetical protein
MSSTSACLPLTASLAALCLVVTAPAHAQTASTARGGPVDTGRSRTGVGVVSLTEVSRENAGLREALRDGHLDLAGVPRDRQDTAQRTRRHDSVLNGVLIGAGVGALLGLIPDYYDDCEECHDSLYASIAVGAGVGLLIDLLRTEKQTVSPAQSDGAFRLGIAAGPTSAGLGGTIRWR